MCDTDTCMEAKAFSEEKRLRMRGHGQATDALVCGIVSIALVVLAMIGLIVTAPNDGLQRALELAVYGAVAASLALGIAAVAIGARSASKDGWSGRAIAGFVCGIVGIVPSIISCTVLALFMR